MKLSSPRTSRADNFGGDDHRRPSSRLSTSDRGLLLPDRGLPGQREARLREPLLPRLERPQPSDPDDPLRDVQSRLLGAEGHCDRRPAPATRQGHVRSRAREGRLRHSCDCATRRRASGHGDEVRTPSRGAREEGPRRVREGVPPSRGRSSSMRSGASSRRRRSTATPRSPRTRALAIGGTTPQSILSTPCSLRWCPASGARRTVVPLSRR